MQLKEKVIFTTLSVIVFCWLVYLVKSILTPFIFSIIIAYLLNPVVERFHRIHNMSRLYATSLILGLFFAIFVSVSLMVLPTIYSQTLDLVNAIPEYFKIATNNIYPKISSLLRKAGFAMESDFSHFAQQSATNSDVINFSKNIINNAITSTVVIINVFSLIFITPILIFYLLKDWNLIIAKINDYLPRTSSSLIRSIFKEIDGKLSGYIRGQLNVCFILGTIYSVLLSFTDLNFGFIIGFLTGMLAFIPYVGMTIGFVVAIIVALFQWGFDVSGILAIIFIFLTGNIIESNLLTPKLIGSKIGIHPAWLIFGLFFFGDLFGFVGVLIAVPLTAICGVIIKHIALEYKRRFT